MEPERGKAAPPRAARWGRAESRSYRKGKGCRRKWKLDLQHARAERPPFVMARRHLQCRQQCRPRMDRVEDRIHPEPGCPVADVGVLLVTGFHLAAQLLQLGGVGLVPLAA